jgi:hypothetical protein
MGMSDGLFMFLIIFGGAFLSLLGWLMQPLPPTA